MTETRNCLQCGRNFAPKRKHHVYDFEECRYQGWIEKEVQAAQASTQRVNGTVHPLADARAQQETSDLKSKLSQIIYQGIVDRLKHGPVHADDLEGLFPEERRSMCRRLVGAQFGSLASRGYIVERERRKSKVKSRKSAKSGVYELTIKGRETLVGNGAGKHGVGASSPSAVSDESKAGVPVPQGLDGPIESESRRSSGRASSDQTLVGVGGETADVPGVLPSPAVQGTPHPGEKVDADVPEPPTQGEVSSSSSPCLGDDNGSPEGACLPDSGEPARLPGLEESSYERLRDKEAA